MMRENSLDQKLDIAGSLEQLDTLNINDEPRKLGKPLNAGNGSNIVVSSTVSIQGLSGMTANSEGNDLEIFGAINSVNNGVFKISSFINSSEVQIVNPSAISESTVFNFIERQPYSLEDDLNYIRTDRSLIKGTTFDGYVPTYLRCEDQNTLIPANLANIAGNTLDAKSIIINKRYKNISVSGTSVTIIDVGNLKHADSVNIIGVPINDGFDVGYWDALYVDILYGYSGLEVLSGPNIGNRIFGITRAGSSVSGNSVEIEFRSTNSSLASSVSYTWEVGQPNVVDLIIGYRECMSGMEETALRDTNGHAVQGSNLPQATQIGQVLYSVDGVNFERALPVTSNYGWIVNEDGILLVNT